MIEVTPGAVAIPHVIRNANQRSVRVISGEIRSIQNCPASSDQSSQRNPFVRMPGSTGPISPAGFG
jgi:hypothetical protein